MHGMSAGFLTKGTSRSTSRSVHELQEYFDHAISIYRCELGSISNCHDRILNP